LADALAGLPPRYEEDTQGGSVNSWGGAPPGWPKIPVADILARFMPRYKRCFAARMRLRMGILLPPGEEEPGREVATDPAIDAWLEWLQASRADYPRASRALAEIGQQLALARTLTGADQRGVLHLAARFVERAAFQNEGPIGAAQEGTEALVKVLYLLLPAICPADAGGRGVPDEAHRADHATLGPGPCASAEAWARRVRAGTPVASFRTNAIRELTTSLVGSDTSERCTRSSLCALGATMSATLCPPV